MIRNLLFDIGNVLLMMDHKSTVKEFSAYTKLPAAEFGPARVFPHEAQMAMERGEITPRSFYEVFLELSGCRLSFEHFVLIWTGHFQPNTPLIRLGAALSKKMGVYFLSNTDPLHIPPLFDKFPQVMFYHGLALSWELGALKPDHRYYRLAMDKLDLDPAECLFLDDRPENVAAAEEFGIRAIQHRNNSETRALLQAALDGQGLRLDSLV